MDSIVNALNNFIDWIAGIPAWIFSLLKNLLSALFDMLADLVAFVLDKLLQGVVSLVGLIPMPAVSFNANSYMAGAPAEFIAFAVAIRLPEAFAIIVAALGIRFLLGLIPLVRVGR